MNIAVYGLEKEAQPSVEHLLRLFFEDARIVYSDAFTEADLSLSVALERKDCHLQARAILEDTHRKQKWEGKHSREVPLSEQEVVRKHSKQALKMAILDAFEQYTGKRQPWGILTGIRPTKLIHDKLAKGMSYEQAIEMTQKQTGISVRKLALMERIIRRQFSAIPDLYHLRGEVSVYIGIPYCPTKCAYCTFPAYDIRGKQGSVSDFLRGLHYEMEKVGQWLKEHAIGVTTVYFGGGTPTSITAEEMDRLYERLYISFPDAQKIREITVEAGRPDTITPEKLEVLKKWKIDRISINPQSYTQATLDAIGRHHTVEETIEKFLLARKMGFHNINMDLIIGLPGENAEHFRRTLEETEKLMPESVTVHTLSYKRASEMTRQKREGKGRVVSEEEIDKMMTLAENWTRKHGYEPYYLYRQKNILGNLENVGYALPGKESLYNILIIEEMQTIVGLGCGAASKWVHPVTGEISRLANPKDPKSYIESVERYTAQKIETLQRLFLDSTDQWSSARDVVSC